MSFMTRVGRVGPVLSLVLALAPQADAVNRRLMLSQLFDDRCIGMFFEACQLLSANCGVAVEQQAKYRGTRPEGFTDKIKYILWDVRADMGSL